MNTTIELKCLKVSPDNVRVLSSNKAQDKELVSSVQTLGILQNLVVVKANKSNYQIIAGGRRYAALQQLLKAGKIKPNHPVPCLVKDNKDDITEISLSENVQRVAMHPADQYVAFTKLAENGLSIAKIAERFGLSKRTVQQRLSLGRVAPQLIEAYRQDKMDLDCLMAFSVCENHERQRACYKEKKHNGLWPLNIKNWLLGESFSTDIGLGKFIGKTAYTKAGGAISTDLFQNKVYLLDAELAQRLAQEKLQKEAEKLNAEQWKWIEVSLEFDTYNNNYVRVHPELVGVPKKVTDEINIMIETLVALEKEADEKGWDEDIEKIYGALGDKINGLEIKRDENYLTYSNKQKAYSGCIVSINHQGDLIVTKGMAYPKDVPQPKGQASEQGNGETEPTNTITQALTSDLQVYRQEAVKATLLKDTETAKDVLHYTLCLQVLAQNSWTGRELMSSQFATINPSTSLNDLEQGRAHQEIQAYRNTLNTEWMAIEDEGERFKAFQRLTPKDKDTLITYCVAESLTINVNGNNPTQDALVDQLSVPFAEYWRPTKTNYFKRLNQAQLLEQFARVRGDRWVDDYKDKSKAAVVKSMEAWINEEPEYQDDPRTLWIPQQF